MIRAVLVAERLRKSIAENRSPPEEEIRVAISLGVTEIVVADYAERGTSCGNKYGGLCRSNAFLYKAKKAGRNRVAANLPEEDEGGVASPPSSKGESLSRETPIRLCAVRFLGKRLGMSRVSAWVRVPRRRVGCPPEDKICTMQSLAMIL